MAGCAQLGFAFAIFARVITERLRACCARAQQEESADCHEFRVLHVFILWQARDLNRDLQSLISKSRTCGCGSSFSREAGNGPVQLRRFAGDAFSQLA